MSLMIKLIGSREEKAECFYLLMTNYSLSSNVLDKFHVLGNTKEILRLLKKNKVKYKVI